MLKTLALLLLATFPTLATTITGGFIDFPSGAFELKSSTFDIFSVIDGGGGAGSIGSSIEPYASGNGPGGPGARYDPLDGFGHGTVNGVYYSILELNVFPMQGVFEPGSPSMFFLSGPTIFGPGLTQTAPFSISGNLNLFTPDGCIVCNISLDGGGISTWVWQHGEIYGGAQAVFAFADAPEPATWVLGLATLGLLLLRARPGFNQRF